jgi:transcriptional regulator with XRE-family HTH domain
MVVILVNLKSLREKAGLSQLELANKLEVGQSVVSQWETNRVLPRANKLEKIAQTLNCTVDDLFDAGDAIKTG